MPEFGAGKSEPEKKTRLYIGLISSSEKKRHKEAVDLLEDLATSAPSKTYLEQFCFVLTGGTYSRLFEGRDPCFPGEEWDALKEPIRRFLLEKCGVIVLKPHAEGGMVLLASLVVQRRVAVLWSLHAPNSHWLLPENNALTRLADIFHVNRLLNPVSIRSWLGLNPERTTQWVEDTNRYLQEWEPPAAIKILSFSELEADYLRKQKGNSPFVFPDDGTGQPGIECRLRGPNGPFEPHYDRKQNQGLRLQGKKRLALIAHNDMKPRMVDFVFDYERQLDRLCSRILTTGTTGAQAKSASPRLGETLYPYRSGPLGGDIQIAAEIVLGLVDAVIFFIDPLTPHPHIDDIRVVFGAAMTNEVEMFTNERQARDWMDRKSFSLLRDSP